MGWGRLDGSSSFHPKVLFVGNAAWGALCRMIAYSCEALTDGFISNEVARTIASEAELAKLFAKQPGGKSPLLVPSNSGDGYLIHDFHDRNPSAETEKARKIEISNKRSVAGKIGNDKRWNYDVFEEDGSQNLSQTHRKRIAKPVANASQTHRPDPDPDLNPPAASQQTPLGGATPRVPRNPRSDIPTDSLSPTEKAVADAIAGDSDMGPIVALKNQTARDLVAAGPGIDVAKCVGDAARWMRANPRRKKHNGSQFLLGWVKREQDRTREPSTFSPRHSPPVIQRYVDPISSKRNVIPPPNYDFGFDSSAEQEKSK